MGKQNFGNTALVVIDMQKGIAGMQRKLEPHDAPTVIKNVAKLVKKFREENLSVFLVHVTMKDGKDMLDPIVDGKPQMQTGERPKDWAEFIDEIKPVESDIIIVKRQWGAFYGTELDLQLRRRKIDTIVLCGISTNIGVESTARSAYECGYNQIFAEDAMTAMGREEHESSIKFIFPRIGVVRNTEEVLNIIKDNIN